MTDTEYTLSGHALKLKKLNRVFERAIANTGYMMSAMRIARNRHKCALAVQAHAMAVAASNYRNINNLNKILPALSQAYSAGLGEGRNRKHLELDPQGFWKYLEVDNPEQQNYHETDFFQFLESSKIMDQFK
jgi:hypothetical protein